MKKSKYRTAPVPSSKLPSGIPFIVGNEAAERFSYYGMRAILVVFMTQYMLDSTGASDLMSEEEAKSYYHLFSSAVYFFPVLGAIIADAILGKYRTIIFLSSLYCLGHFFLAIDDTRMGLLLGLSLIALGSGGIKPCVSAHVGDQFGKTNSYLLGKIFSWFYFSINLGAFFSSLLTPWLLANHGPSWAFGVPGFFMFIATLLFWMGRNRFVHIPPGGLAFLKETFSREGICSLLKLFLIYIFVAVFWSLFDQTGSSWVLQAEKMDRYLFGIQWLSSQVQALNPVLVILFIPFFSYGVYPLINKFFPLTPLRKISMGFFLAVPAFIIPAWVENQIQMGQAPSIAWQLLSYVFLTAAEVMVSITCIEFSYTQAPKKMKSFVMAGFMLSVSLGNVFTALVNVVIQDKQGTSKLIGAEYFLFFAGAMLLAAFIFIPVAMLYKEKYFIQDESGDNFIGEVEAEF
jgi:POT family proton-dependent oligopeptide transporter